MALSNTLVLPAIILVIALLWFRKFRSDAQFRTFARQHACAAPNHSASALPWGIDRMIRMVRLTAQHADVMETVIMPGFARFGWTFSSAGLLGENFLLTADPENIKAMLQSQFADFLAGAPRIGPFGYMVGTNIFTTDGAFWERSRALFRPHFARGEIHNLEATERAVSELLIAILAHGGEKAEGAAGWTETMNLQDLFLRFTLDTGTEFLFGANVKSQLAAIPADKRDGGKEEELMSRTTQMAADRAGDDMTFGEAFHVASLEVIKRAKLQKWYWLMDSADARRAVKYLREFIDQLVTVQLAEKAPAGEKTNLLQELAKDTSDPIELRDQVLFMLTASRDTTAALLSWVFLMLAKHPAILEKLREEILKEFGTEYDASKITFYGLKKCLYLQWVMLETLRLYPPGPLNSRIAARDTTLPVGGGRDGRSPIAVRKGQTVNMCVYAMHRRPDLWGEDVMDFRPERWQGRKTDWAFLPFSGGPRTCLGREYALTEAGFVMVRLLQHFDRVESVGDLTDIRQFVTTTLEPTDGVKVRLRKAASVA